MSAATQSGVWSPFIWARRMQIWHEISAPILHEMLFGKRRRLGESFGQSFPLFRRQPKDKSPKLNVESRKWKSGKSKVEKRKSPPRMDATRLTHHRALARCSSVWQLGREPASWTRACKLEESWQASPQLRAARMATKLVQFAPGD